MNWPEAVMISIVALACALVVCVSFACQNGCHL